MAKVLEIKEKVRQKVKSVIYQCQLCKKYHGKPFNRPATMMLPVFLTTLSRAFENTCVDFAGPFEFKIVTGNFGRAYLALFTCAI